MKNFLKIFLALFVFFVFAAVPSYAITFDLIAPSGTLQSGQNVQFTINVNTEGQSMTSTSVGMTYDTQYVQYVSASAGNTFTTVSANDLGGGKLVLTGSSDSGYSGSGSFAVVTFKIIATSPGSTTLCALYNPDTPTPTPAPGNQPTTPPQPTSLPTTGQTESTTKGALLGFGFFSLAALGFFILKNV